MENERANQIACEALRQAPVIPEPTPHTSLYKPYSLEPNRLRRVFPPLHPALPRAHGVRLRQAPVQLCSLQPAYTFSVLSQMNLALYLSALLVEVTLTRNKCGTVPQLFLPPILPCALHPFTTSAMQLTQATWLPARKFLVEFINAALKDCTSEALD